MKSNNLKGLTEQFHNDNETKFDPTMGYFFEDVILENVEEIFSSGMTGIHIIFNNEEKILVRDKYQTSLNEIKQLLSKDYNLTILHFDENGEEYLIQKEKWYEWRILLSVKVKKSSLKLSKKQLHMFGFLCAVTGENPMASDKKTYYWDKLYVNFNTKLITIEKCLKKDSTLFAIVGLAKTFKYDVLGCGFYPKFTKVQKKALKQLKWEFELNEKHFSKEELHERLTTIFDEKLITSNKILMGNRQFIEGWEIRGRKDFFQFRDGFIEYDEDGFGVEIN